MHSFGSMKSFRSVPSSKWMQSTGQTDTHETSSTSMHGSAITYAIQDPPRHSPISRSSALPEAYHPARSGGRRATRPAHRDLHPAFPVTGDVAADQPGGGRRDGRDRPGGGRGGAGIRIVVKSGDARRDADDRRRAGWRADGR